MFGIEGLFHPLWISPLAEPLRMLRIALWWGIGFLLATQLISMHNRYRAGDWAGFWFGAEGLAGGLLYLGGVAWAYLGLGGGGNPSPAALACGAGFALVLVHRVAHQPAPWPGRFFYALAESLESVFGYFVNTLSFMRVAAFSISHVALAAAVAGLAAELEPTGRILTLLLGNLFIVAMEGAIVAIQVLRLEYYEGFSRFFSCFGREFRPLGLPAAGPPEAGTAGRPPS